ncbi:MAG: potassium-transporting ATPase subunit KdpC [Sphingomonadaceae bacterium]|nr:potassium-transporting ATPase subunit KdpC [Sphingomonadaceae bacterium]
MRSDLITALRPALALTLAFALLLGLGYPLALTGAGQLLFPAEASGSLVRAPGTGVRGSELIGQAFTQPRDFHGRPSAAGNGYDPLASGGSNLGPASRKLIDRVRQDQSKLGAVAPADLLLAPGSGLDPHISPEAALFQANRVAAARGLRVDEVRRLVEARTERPLLGFLGEPRVNVLKLNLALDRAAARR